MYILDIVTLFDCILQLPEPLHTKKVLTLSHLKYIFTFLLHIDYLFNPSYHCLYILHFRCGKTTQVPQFILDESMYGKGLNVSNIICTQPRRISATAVADRVAKERTTRVGDIVGYQIRLENKQVYLQWFILILTIQDVSAVARWSLAWNCLDLILVFKHKMSTGTYTMIPFSA